MRPENVMGNCFVTNTIYFLSPPAAYNSWERTAQGECILFTSVCVVFKNEAISSSDGGRFCLFVSWLFIYWLLWCPFSQLPFNTCKVYKQLASCSFLKSTTMWTPLSSTLIANADKGSPKLDSVYTWNHSRLHVYLPQSSPLDWFSFLLMISEHSRIFCSPGELGTSRSKATLHGLSHMSWRSSLWALLSTHPRRPVNPNQLQFPTSSRHSRLHMEPLQVVHLLAHKPLKIQILNHSWSLKCDKFPWDWKEGIHQHALKEVFMATLKTQICPLLQLLFSLLWAVWTTVSPRVATGICVSLEPAWVTIHFPSWVFGHGNIEQPVLLKRRWWKETSPPHPSAGAAHSFTLSLVQDDSTRAPCNPSISTIQWKELLLGVKNICIVLGTPFPSLQFLHLQNKIGEFEWML